MTSVKQKGFWCFFQCWIPQSTTQPNNFKNNDETRGAILDIFFFFFFLFHVERVSKIASKLFKLAGKKKAEKNQRRWFEEIK